MSTPVLVTDNACYPESPRWRDGRLWFSDVHDYAVKHVDHDGVVTRVVDIPGRPAGLGFLPDGSLLIAGALDRRLLRWASNALTEVADLTDIANGLLNDMVVDSSGRALVGDTGFNLMSGDEQRPGRIITVDIVAGTEPDVFAIDVMFPNGAAISDDGRTYWLAETVAQTVTRFELGTDGHPRSRSTVINLPDICDGLCVDEQGNVWVALLRLGEFWHVNPAGDVLNVISAEGRLAVSCVLGGPERRDLFLCSAATTMAELAQGRSRGLIHRFEVPIPGSGLP